MTPELIALLIAVVAGAALTLAFDRNARGSRVAGEAILLGIGACAAVLFLLTMIGIAWTRVSFGVAIAIVVLSVLPSAARNLRRSAGDSSAQPLLLMTRAPHPAFGHLLPPGEGTEVHDLQSPLPLGEGGRRPGEGRASLKSRSAIAVVCLGVTRWGALSLDVLTILLILGYARFATLAPLWEFDFIGDFGLKARTFWEARGLDWPFLDHAFHRVIHPDYPQLLPFAFDLFAIIRGDWNDAAMGLVTVAFGVALLLVIRRVALEESGSPLVAAFITAAMVPFACSPWIGLAEGPFVAYGTVALLLMRRGDVTIGAVMLGLAASAKNEGLTLIVAIAIALLIARRARDVVKLWPAVAIPLPWLIVKSIHHLGNDLTEGSVFARVLDHLRDPMPLLTALAHYPLGKRFFWIALAIGIIVAIRPLVTRERFVLAAVALQFGFYIAAYLATPHDLDWHVKWSWERLISHLTPALTFVVLLNLVVRWSGDRVVVEPTTS